MQLLVCLSRPLDRVERHQFLFGHLLAAHRLREIDDRGRGSEVRPEFDLLAELFDPIEGHPFGHLAARQLGEHAINVRVAQIAR